MSRTAYLISALAVSLAAAAASEPARLERRAFERPENITFPASAPYSPQAATLGKMLFFDPRLSGGQNMSCATCHNPSFGWETPVPRAIGARNVPLERHAPSIENLAGATHLLWDGRAPDLETQAIGPITHPEEMNSNLTYLVDRLREITTYRERFEIAFPGEGLTEATLLRALATFERTLQSGWAAFDDWVAGEEDAISPAAKRGFDLFIGKARCASCHSGWAFTDHAFHDTGLETSDLGRFEVDSSHPEMRHAFKTPGLRNIALRAPYMHDGSLPTLRAVIRHYLDGGVPRPSRAPELEEIDLSKAEIADLIAFLQTLSAHHAHVAAPALPVE